LEAPPGLETGNRYGALAAEDEDDIPEATEEDGDDDQRCCVVCLAEGGKKKRMQAVKKQQWKPLRQEVRNGHAMSLESNLPSAPVHALSENRWMTIDPTTKWRRIKSVMDSGASDNCAPPELAPEIPIVESEGSRQGQKYTAAGGKSIDNLGEKTLDKMVVNEGAAISGTYQMAEVMRPLNSVRRVCQNGNRVIFEYNGGIIQNIYTGEEIAFGVEDNIYTLDLWLPPVGEKGEESAQGNASGFPRQGWWS